MADAFPCRNVRRPTLLLVDDEPHVLLLLRALLADEFDVLTAGCARDAQALLGRCAIDILLTDQLMPEMTGTQLLEWVREHSPRTVRLLMTGFAEVEDAVEAINRGQVYHYLSKPWRAGELRQVLRNVAEKVALERRGEQLLQELRQVNLELEQRVADRTRELAEANYLLQQRTRELETLARTDPLTSLPNRRAIDDLAGSELDRHTRYRDPLALAVIDADHFGEINRRYLYPGGDQALIRLAATLAGSLRTVDRVGRIGGEEFLVVAPGTNYEGAVHLGERIRAEVERNPADYRDERIDLTVSIGFAVLDGTRDAGYDQVKHVASAALGEAKAAGRNRCVVRLVS